MAKNSAKSICLSVDRHEKVILVDTIVYARVVDKLCTIHFTDEKPVSVFLTLSALLGMLPEKEFIQINRGCLVALQYIKNVTERFVIMSNGTELLYSSRKKSSILYAFQESLSQRANSHQALSWKQDFSAEFRCLDHCPMPFFILECVTDRSSKTPSFVVRYANDAMAAFRQTPLRTLVNSQFEPDGFTREHVIYMSEVAYIGKTKVWFQRHRASGTHIHIVCYQPHYGYCACFVLPTVQDPRDLLMPERIRMIET